MIGVDAESLLARRSANVLAEIGKIIPESQTPGSISSALGKSSALGTGSVNASISSPVWDILLRGGKRWRPVLFSVVCDAFGGNSSDFPELPAFIELLHSGSLIIDDIEDSSGLRRGKPAIHMLHGVDIALNAGNAMYFMPLLVLLRNREKYRRFLLRIYEEYAQAAIRLHFGQAADIAWHRGIASPSSEEEYLEMCRLKTGSLACLAARLGAIVAGADEAQVAAVGALAESLGAAFQVRDDVLNLSVGPGRGQFTKEYMGSDISEGKRSLPVIHALQHASSRDRARLLEILAAHTKGKPAISEALSIIGSCGSLEYSKSVARSIVESSWAGAAGSIPDSPAKKELEALANFAVRRTF